MTHGLGNLPVVRLLRRDSVRQDETSPEVDQRQHEQRGRNNLTENRDPLVVHGAASPSVRSSIAPANAEASGSWLARASWSSASEVRCAPSTISAARAEY